MLFTATKYGDIHHLLQWLYKLEKSIKCYQQSYMVNKSPENYYCCLDTNHISLGLNTKKERAPDDNYVCIKQASKGCFICAKNKTKMLTSKKKKNHIHCFEAFFTTMIYASSLHWELSVCWSLFQLLEESFEIMTALEMPWQANHTACMPPNSEPHML